ncbi:MAG: helix-turn-helix transcriptional regulator [Acidimicrobiaceae bacterium]|nr:helix-turn-helix transcriptional regulator [Acidimicrobiaceae bacterium]MDE0493337.1 helix-turn-helix transcriptional regulator [Acidimicrobiaceae bacterium]
MRSPPDVARFVGSVAAVATSAASAEDRIDEIIDEIARILPFVGMCINASPDAGERNEIVCSRGYPDRILGRLGSRDFLEEWRGLKPSSRGTRLKETWDLDPLPVTVRDYVVPLGFRGGVSIPLSTASGVVAGGMHFSTERAEDITDLAHYGLCLIAPTLNNLVESLPPRSEGPPLSGREREVLELIARGKSNAEIADDLFISQRTAATHVEHILFKLGAANRAHAAVLGLQLQLIPTN